MTLYERSIIGIKNKSVSKAKERFRILWLGEGKPEFNLRPWIVIKVYEGHAILRPRKFERYGRG